MIPEHGNQKFQCPHCQTVATQRWFSANNASTAANDILSHIYLDYRTRIRDSHQTAIKSFLKSIESDFNRNFNSFVPKGF